MRRNILFLCLSIFFVTECLASGGAVIRELRVSGMSNGDPNIATDGYRHRVSDTIGKGLFKSTPVQILSADPTLAPITLSFGYKLGIAPEAVAPLFGGNAVATNDSTNAILAGFGGNLTLIANTLSTSVRSDDLSNAIVLTAGHNLEQIAASKGLQSSTSARGLPSSLATYVDEDTCDTTPSLLPNDAIVMFELDSNDPTSAEYDFADLIVLVNFQTLVTSSDIGLAPLGTGDNYICGTTAQPYIRDSIGPDSSATDNTDGYLSMLYSPTTYDIPSFEIPAGFPGEVKYFDLVAGDFFGSCSQGVQCYGDFLFTLSGWNNHAELSLSPGIGTLFNIDVTPGLSLTPLFGSSDDGTGIPGFPVFPTSLLQFSTNGLGANCPTTGCVVALTASRIGSTYDVLEIRVSNLGAGYTDIAFGDLYAGQQEINPGLGVRFSVGP